MALLHNADCHNDASQREPEYAGFISPQQSTGLLEPPEYGENHDHDCSFSGLRPALLAICNHELHNELKQLFYNLNDFDLTIDDFPPLDEGAYEERPDNEPLVRWIESAGDKGIRTMTSLRIGGFMGWFTLKSQSENVKVVQFEMYSCYAEEDA